MIWSKKPFIAYLIAVDDLLDTVFGITSLDVNLDLISECRNQGDTPEGCVGYIASKYNLTSKTELGDPLCVKS